MSGRGQEQDPLPTGSAASVISLVLGGVGATLALSPDAVFIALFLGLGGLAALPLGLSDLRHLVGGDRSRATKQAVAGGVLSVVALALVAVTLLGSAQQDAIDRSALGPPGSGAVSSPAP